MGEFKLRGKGTLIAGVKLANRFRKDNFQFYGEYYRKLLKGTWGYVSADFSPNHTFLPEYSAGGGIYRYMLGNEWGINVRFMKFRNSDVFLLIPSAIIYLPGDVLYRVNLYLNTGRGTYSLLNVLERKGKTITLFAGLSFGTSSERLQAGEDFRRYNTLSIRAGAELALTRGMSVRLVVRREVREGLYTRNGVELYGGFGW
ncbi:MAG: YaiO family outer membrane beta-barrel protein [Aquificota bacterium]|nr:YaiO family outer membrane beta-barrel protein [Aquificota bacterium]